MSGRKEITSISLLNPSKSRTLRWEDENEKGLDSTTDQETNVIKANICLVA